MSISAVMETTQFLTFKLDDEVFAIDISQVREALDFTMITKVPRTKESAQRYKTQLTRRRLRS